MYKKGLINIIVAVSLLFFIFINCSKQNNLIKIGAILPLSGDGAVYGKAAQGGIEIAIEESNSNGGVLGKNIKVIYEDDEGLANQAVSAFEKLVSQDKVPVVIGSMYSSNTLAIAPIAEKMKVVLFSPASSTPELTNAGDYIFRNWPSDNFEGSEMAKFAYEDLNIQKVGIIYVQNDYGVGLKNAFVNEFEEMDGLITSSEGYQKDATDYRTQLIKMNEDQPEAIYLPGYYNEIGQILKQAKQLNINVQFLSCVSFEDPEVLEIAGDAANGVIYAVPAYDPNSQDPYIQNFVDKYKQKYGDEPGAFAAHGYDALKIVAVAIENGGYTSEGIKESLYKIKNFKGVTGLTTIDDNGDVVKPIRIKIVRNGRFESY